MGNETKAAAAPDPRFAPVHALVEEAIAGGVFPGAAWAVLCGQEVLATEAAGRFTYSADSPTVHTGTRWDLASVSKAVATTAMCMLLTERGLLDLHTPLGDLLPGFAVGGGRDRARVTLRHLLAHNSGLPGYAPLFEHCRTPSSLLGACLRMPLESAPGERAEYSDPGFILLGKALEVFTGERLDRWCSREIFRPLGMEHTGYSPAAAERLSIPPTERDEHFRHAVVQGVVHDENCYVLGGCAGHAGLFAPVGDVLRFAATLLAGHPRPLFRPETIKLFTRRTDEPAGSSRALGWDTPSAPSSSGELFSPRSFGHLGYTGTSLWIDGEQQVAVVLLTHRTWPTRTNGRIREFRPAFHDAVMRAAL